MVCCSIVFSDSAQAEIFKCKKASGGFSFQDKPCTDNESEEIIELKQQKKDTPSKNKSSKLTTTDILGQWCEFAASMEIKGVMDTSSPATWNFKNKSKMSYTYKSARKGTERFHGYKIKDNTIAVDNSLIGTWGVVSFNSYSLILSGPYGGYVHLRRGGC
jgi:hypothetical protein